MFFLAFSSGEKSSLVFLILSVYVRFSLAARLSLFASGMLEFLIEGEKLESQVLFQASRDDDLHVITMTSLTLQMPTATDWFVAREPDIIPNFLLHVLNHDYHTIFIRSCF